MMLPARLVAALRDNPLVRYGSPARRLTVPRALWWLAFGASLFGSCLLSLAEGLVPSGLEPYQWALVGTCALMPALVGLCFVGFAYPSRRTQLRPEAVRATAADVFAAYAWWPAVASGLLVVPLMLVPWAAAVLAWSTPFVSQDPVVFAGRVVESVGLPFWTVLRVAVAVRVWDRRPARWWLVPVSVSLKSGVHLLWMTSLVIGSGSFLRLALEVADVAIHDGRAHALAALLRPLESLPWTIQPWENRAVLLTILILALAFEAWRSLSMLDRSPAGAKPAGAIPEAPISPVPRRWLGGWWALALLGIACFEAASHLRTRVFYLPLVEQPRYDLSLDLTAVLVAVVAIAIVDSVRRSAWRDDTRLIADSTSMALLGRHLWLPCWLVFLYDVLRYTLRHPAEAGSISLWFLIEVLHWVVVAMAELYLVLTFIVATLRPPGPRHSLAGCWLVFALLVYLPPLAGIPSQADEESYGWSLLNWYRVGGRWSLVSLVAMGFLAFGWRACAMWFELTKHRLVDPEGAPR